MAISPEVIDKIKELAAPQLYKIDDITYASKSLHEVEKNVIDVRPRLNFNTLTGLIDYIKSGNETIPEKSFIVVEDYNKVNLYAPVCQVGKYDIRRECLAEVILIEYHFDFNVHHDSERFMVALQTLFVENDALKSIMDLAGNIVVENGVTTKDGGASQEITVRQGITFFSNKKVENPYTLQPYRTFSEVEQPASQYVLRVKPNDNKFALFSAGGNTWRLKAIENIKAFLSSKIKDYTIIA